MKDKIEYKKSGAWHTLTTVDISGPFTIPTGGSVDIPYSITFTPVSGATAYRNIALVGLANYTGGFHEFSYTIEFSTSGGTITHNAFADVTDSLQGYLGEAWVGNPDTQTFTYDRQIGPYALTGDYEVKNTATVTGKDSKKTDSDSECVDVRVRELGSVTVIKDVRDPNGNQTDDGHHFWVKLYVKTGSHSWSQVGSGWTEFWEGHPAVFNDLEQGKEYKVEEKDVDDNYYYNYWNDGPKTLDCENVDITVLNKQRTGSITIEKIVKSSSGGNVNDDHHFWVKLYVQNDSGGWDLVPGTNPKEFWEGYSGHPKQDAVFTNLIKGRTYKAEEVVDPNYTLWSITPATILLECEPTIEIVNRQCPTGSITVTKGGLEGSDQANLSLYNTNGTPGTGDDTLVPVSPQTVSNGGTASWTNLPYGDYYIKEDFSGITNVYTYSVSNPVANITVDGVEAVRIRNCAEKGSITVTKTGLEGEDQANLSLYNTNGTPGTGDDTLVPVSPQTVSNGGTASWTNLPYGNYYIVEDFNGITNVYTYSVSNPAANITVDGDETDTIGNTAERGSIEIFKTDATNGQALGGSTFELYKWGSWILIDTVVLGPDGHYIWENLPFGLYKVVETFAPPGYLLAPPVEVTLNGETPNVILREEIADPRIPGRITVIKRDEAGANLDGVGFTIYYKDSGNAVMPEKFTAGGVVTFDGLGWNTYIVVETTQPAGFDKSGPVEVTIDASNAEAGVIITLTDKKTPPPPPRRTTGGGEITVLGIQELPFTGMNPAIPISGISSIFAGGLMVMLSSIKKRLRRK